MARQMALSMCLNVGSVNFPLTCIKRQNSYFFLMHVPVCTLARGQYRSLRDTAISYGIASSRVSVTEIFLSLSLLLCD